MRSIPGAMFVVWPNSLLRCKPSWRKDHAELFSRLLLGLLAILWEGLRPSGGHEASCCVYAVRQGICERPSIFKTFSCGEQDMGGQRDAVHLIGSQGVGDET